VDKHLALKFGQKNVPGSGKAKTTQSKKGTGKKTNGGPNSKQQPRKKRKRQYSVGRPGKSRKSEEQQQATKGPPMHRPQPRTSNKKGQNGKGNRGGKHNAGRNGLQTRRKYESNISYIILPRAALQIQLQRRSAAVYRITVSRRIPTKPLWTNVTTALSNMHPITYFSRPSNMAFHHMCTTLLPPPGVDSLHARTGPQVLHPIDPPKVIGKHTIFQFIRQIRLKYWMSES
jgi:hypothetical protein